MKKMKRKLIIPATVVLLGVIFACSKKFLDKPPLGTLNPQVMATEKGVQGLLIGAYSLVDGEGASGDAPKDGPSAKAPAGARPSPSRFLGSPGASP